MKFSKLGYLIMLASVGFSSYGFHKVGFIALIVGLSLVLSNGEW